MTSQGKILANRLNGQKSRGPRSSEGKRASSRNSRKHGLASRPFLDLVGQPEIEALVRAFCGDDEDPELPSKARIVAENELMLRAVREQKLAVIERLRDPAARALSAPDNSLAQARARFEAGKAAQELLDELIPLLAAIHHDKLPMPLEEFPVDGRNELVLCCLEELLTPAKPTGTQAPASGHPEQDNARRQRYEHEALKAAASDLTRLERYERRAWSRQKRALRDLIDMKRMRDPGA